MDKSVIIIGAGIAGLSAGCYGQMNGYRTRVLEMHDKPGGLCTAWERKGYTIDGCLHWLTGSAPGVGMYSLWEELGIIQGQQVINADRFWRFESADGRAFDMYADLDRLEKHMLELAPEDQKIIRETVKAVRSFTKLDMPVDKAPELYTLFDGLRLVLKMAPALGSFSKYSRMTGRQFAERFQSPLLRKAWESAWLPEFSVVFLLITMALLHRKQAGYVMGGSMAISRAIEKRYLDLGGEISYRSPVSRILVEGDRAVGVALEDGSEYRADYVISAADGHATIFDLLGGKYVDDRILGYYRNLRIFQPLVYIGLGVNRQFNDIPESVSGLVLELDRPLHVAGHDHNWLNVHAYSFDPSMAPAGKTAVTVMFESDFDYWSSLSADRTKYKQEKQAIADSVIERLDGRFPGLKAQVEMVDVATPLTFRRYTGNWQGSFEGWQMTPEIVTLNMKKTLPGLDNFYMAGQWVQPGGGIPGGAMTGRYAIQLMCKRDRKKFRAERPT